MKLSFNKDKENNITIKIIDGISEIDFDYIEMIKLLYPENKFDQTIFEGDFSEDEKQRIADMLKEINAAVVVSNVSND